MSASLINANIDPMTLAFEGLVVSPQRFGVNLFKIPELLFFFAKN